MAMSRKNYIEAAAIIDAQVKAAELETPVRKRAVVQTARYIAYDLADMFAADNYHFDRTRFMNACGFGNPNGN
jgi:hypothetical protein